MYGSADNSVLYVVVTFKYDLFRECCFIAIPDGAANDIKIRLMFYARVTAGLHVSHNTDRTCSV